MSSGKEKAETAALTIFPLEFAGARYELLKHDDCERLFGIAIWPNGKKLTWVLRIDAMSAELLDDTPAAARFIRRFVERLSQNAPAAA